MKNQNSFAPALLLAIILVLASYVFFTKTTPSNNPSEEASTIQSGSDLDKAASDLDTADTDQIDTDLNELNADSSTF